MGKRNTQTDDGPVIVLCPACGAANWVNQDRKSFACEACTTTIQFAACAYCHDSTAMPAGTEFPKSMDCNQCQRSVSRSLWGFGVRSAADWYRSNYDFVVTQWIDNGRRLISGTVAGSTGMFGVAEGEYCMMLFDEDQVLVMFDQSESQVWPFDSISGLDFGGSGASVMKSGGGWGGGGFGLAGFAVGLGVAAALNKATTKTHVLMDSYMAIASGEKSVILASSDFDPTTLRALMDAPMARIQAARESTGERLTQSVDELAGESTAGGESTSPAAHSDTSAHSQRISLLRELASLRDDGIITEAEFEEQKRAILAQSQ